MEEGPFRMPRQAAETAKTANDQPPTESGRADQPKPVNREPKPVHRSLSHTSLQDKKSKKPFIIAAAVAVAVVLLGAGIWSILGLAGSAAGIDGGKYQAVFFTNGQVYFGKLKKIDGEYMQLTDVYYLQAKATEAEDTKLQSTSDNANLDNVTMIKLGQEIHGPDDKMVINKDQVLFYENLKTDGKVSKAIETYKNPNSK